MKQKLLIALGGKYAEKFAGKCLSKKYIFMEMLKRVENTENWKMNAKLVKLSNINCITSKTSEASETHENINQIALWYFSNKSLHKI